MKYTITVGAVCCVSLLWGTICLSAAEKGGIADAHKAQGIDCSLCHGADESDLVPNMTCLECHDSYDALAERTKDMHLNPHRSAHFIELDCTSCHDGHKAGSIFCQDCHGPIDRQK